MRTLTDKQKKVAQEIAKETRQPIDIILSVYNCGGKNPRDSAKVIWSNLKANERFNEYLSQQQTLVKDIRYSESTKLADILAEIFPGIEKARILVEIARNGTPKDKLSALEQINRLQDEFPKPEEKSGIEIGELKILMVNPKTKEIEAPKEDIPVIKMADPAEENKNL